MVRLSGGCAQPTWRLTPPQRSLKPYAAIVVNEYNCLVLDRTVPDGDTIDLVKVGQSRGTGWLEAPHEGVLRRSYETLPIFGSTG